MLRDIPYVLQAIIQEIHPQVVAGGQIKQQGKDNSAPHEQIPHSEINQLITQRDK